MAPGGVDMKDCEQGVLTLRENRSPVGFGRNTTI